MRIAVAATTAVAAGALLFGVPAAASASTPNSLLGGGSAPYGSSAGFQQVAQGQTRAQVEQEMGRAGRVVLDNSHHGFENLQEDWRNPDTHGVTTFAISFDAPPGGTFTEDDKTTIPTILAS